MHLTFTHGSTRPLFISQPRPSPISKSYSSSHHNLSAPPLTSTQFQLNMHERDIASIASLSKQACTVACSTQLSFLLGTSLAAAKRLTWVQTPWLQPKLQPNERKQIADAMFTHIRDYIPEPAIDNALFFGTAYYEDESDAPNMVPQLYIVFPSLKRDVSRDVKLLTTWHDEIVRPAFNRAWEDSGLTDVWSAHFGFNGSVGTPGTGTYHYKEANKAAGLLAILQNGSDRFVQENWPSWTDDWGVGLEGKYSSVRARVYDEAWRSMVGMLNAYPGLEELQNPRLLFVYQARTYLNAASTSANMYGCIARQLDKTLDSQYLVQGSLKIVVNIVLADQDVVAEEVDKDMERVKGVKYKRLAIDDGYESERREKCVRIKT